MTEKLVEAKPSMIVLIIEHAQNATDADLGAHVRAAVDAGVRTIQVRPRPPWMTRDAFLSVGEVEKRDIMTDESL